MTESDQGATFRGVDDPRTFRSSPDGDGTLEFELKPELTATLGELLALEGRSLILHAGLPLEDEDDA